jgi:hypothetical protein
VRQQFWATTRRASSRLISASVPIDVSVTAHGSAQAYPMVALAGQWRSRGLSRRVRAFLSYSRDRQSGRVVSPCRFANTVL